MQPIRLNLLQVFNLLLFLHLLLLLPLCAFFKTGVQPPLRRPVHVPMETETRESNDARQSAGLHAG
jgi:hypothetical protein